MKAQAQTPAEGIMEINDYGHSKWYYVNCECSDPDHAHIVAVEADDDFVGVSIYTRATSPWWSKNRWHLMWQLLTKGYVDTEAVALLNTQQAINYAEALSKASAEVQKRHAQRIENNKNK